MKKIYRIMKRVICYIGDLPTTLYFNFRCLTFKQAIRLPIRVKRGTKHGILSKKSISIKSEDIFRSMILLGFRGGKFINSSNGYISIYNGGHIEFRGACNFAEGFSFSIEGGNLVIGKNFYANRNLCIECTENIIIGDNNLIGWNVSIRDTDGHRIFENDVPKILKAPITIDNHVWIASDTIILKGTHISDGSIVACNSLVNGLKVIKNNSLIAGIPAKIKKSNIRWEE